jgi:hypothetical protein
VVASDDLGEFAVTLGADNHVNLDNLTVGDAEAKD